MPKDEMTDEVERIKDALAMLLDECVKRDLARPPLQPGEPLPLLNFAERAEHPVLSRKRSEIRWLYNSNDPVAVAYRIAIRLLGERLFELLGNTDAMVTIAEEACNRDGERHYGHKIDIVDKRWDGIGDWHS